jgi:hypothetical protein
LKGTVKYVPVTTNVLKTFMHTKSYSDIESSVLETLLRIHKKELIPEQVIITKGSLRGSLRELHKPSPFKVVVALGTQDNSFIVPVGSMLVHATLVGFYIGPEPRLNVDVLPTDGAPGNPLFREVGEINKASFFERIGVYSNPPQISDVREVSDLHMLLTRSAKDSNLTVSKKAHYIIEILMPPGMSVADALEQVESNLGHGYGLGLGCAEGVTIHSHLGPIMHSKSEVFYMFSSRETRVKPGSGTVLVNDGSSEKNSYGGSLLDMVPVKGSHLFYIPEKPAEL